MIEDTVQTLTHSRVADVQVYEFELETGVTEFMYEARELHVSRLGIGG